MTRRSTAQICFAAGMAALAASASYSSAQAVAAGTGKAWASTWSDEFNHGAADLTGWTYDVGTGSGWGNNEVQNYTFPAGAPNPTPNPNGGFGSQTTPTVGTNNANVFVSSDATGAGALTLRAIGTTVGSNTTYTSGRIKTMGASSTLFSMGSGLLEFRAKLPSGNGLWPAMWMMPKTSAYGGWPTSGEIDIMEAKGQDTGFAQSTLHSGPNSGADNAQGKSFQQSGLRPAGWSITDWHTYDFKWESAGTSAGTLSFYIDGLMYHSEHGGWTVPGGANASAPFDQQFYLIFNMAVGGNFVGNLKPGAGQYDMQIDYVRAFQNITSSATPQWGADADDDWSAYTRWTSQVVPNSNISAALFGSAILSGRTVTVDTPVTIAQLTFDNINSYTLAGSQTLSMNTTASPTAINVLSGNHTISAPLMLARTTNVTVNPGSTLTATNLQVSTIGLNKSGAGMLAVKNLRVGGLLAAAGTVHVIPDGTAASTSKLGTISFAGGSMDLSDNDLIVTATPLATITNAIVDARNGGGWTGTGLTTSVAPTRPSTGLGAMSGTDYRQVNGGTTTFDSFTVANSDVLVKFTYYGDSDFNGKIDGADYARIDGTFNNEHSGPNYGGWVNGDSNYDGKVDGADYGLIDAAFNSQSGTLRPALQILAGGDPGIDPDKSLALQIVRDHLAQFGEPYASAFTSSVPEPTAAGAVVVTVLAMAQRRRRGKTQNNS